MMRCIGFLVFVLAAAAPCRADLVHHYPFTVDAADVVGGADGALFDGAAVLGGVLTLDGMNDYVQIGQHIVPTSGSYTVAMYARQSAPQSGIVELISQGASAGPGFYIGHDASGIIRASDMWLFTGVPFGAIGVMHHYALTVDATAGESKLYFDGTLAATLGAAIATTTSGSNTRFGRQFDPFGEFFGGVLDDIRIYDHALSAAEVAGLSAIPEASPVLLVGAISAIAVVWRWFSRRGEVGPN